MSNSETNESAGKIASAEAQANPVPRIWSLPYPVVFAPNLLFMSPPWPQAHKCGVDCKNGVHVFEVELSQTAIDYYHR